MKNTILFLLLSITTSQYNFAQSTTKLFDLNNVHYDVGLLFEPFGLGFGAIHKVSIKTLNSKHFEGLVGFAWHHNHSFKSPFETNITPLITTNELSQYLTNDWKYYPFKKKHFFIGIGVFVGLTNSVTKGTLELPAHHITEHFYNKHTYLNYGAMQTIGWSFSERIQLGFYSMISLKGLLDQGRSRLSEVDSRFHVGINLGFRFIPKTKQ